MTAEDIHIRAQRPRFGLWAGLRVLFSSINDQKVLGSILRSHNDSSSHFHFADEDYEMLLKAVKR